MKRPIVWFVVFILILNAIFFAIGYGSNQKESLYFNSSSSIKGIDVSHWQGNVNWTKVKNSGIIFAFVKATEGTSYVDSDFEENMEKAHAAGLYVGAYHFAEPENYNAKEAAEHFVDTIEPYLKSGYLRPVLDLEEGSSLGKESLSSWINEFMIEVFNLTGIKPIIYTNPNYAENYLDSSVSQWNLWIANYGVSSPSTGIWDSWAFWQYTNEGNVSGVSGNVDMDYYNGNLRSLIDNFVIGGLRTLPYYDRVGALGYAYKWYSSNNPHYQKFSNSSEESANFVSQVLIAGGVSLWRGYDGKGDGALNYNGSIINPKYLNENLREYQNAKFSYYLASNFTVPEWIEKGDVVIFGDSNGEHYIYAGIVTYRDEDNLYIATHSPDEWNVSISSFFPSKYDLVNFYHIPNGSKKFMQVFRVTATALNIRTGPGTSYGIIGTVPENQEFVAYNYSIDSSGRKWWQFFYDERVGWCAAWYTEMAYSDIFVVNVSSTLHVRSGAGTSNTILGSVYDGMLFAKKGQEYNSDEDITWYEIYWENKSAWIAGNYANYVPEFNIPYFLFIILLLAILAIKRKFNGD